MNGETQGGVPAPHECQTCKKVRTRTQMRGDPEPGIEPWEKQPAEPPIYFEVFDRFRLMGPDRSIRGAVREWYAARNEAEPARREKRWYEAARRWRWDARADAFWRQENRKIERLLERDRQRDRKIRLSISRLARRKFADSLASLTSARIDALNPKLLIEALLSLNEEIRIETLDTPDDRKARKAENPETFELPRLEDRLNDDE